jgi:hypothetical protein
MLNMEYARLVDLERRRVADARIELERALHDAAASRAVDAPVTSRAVGPGRTALDSRGVPGPAR